MVRLSPMQCPVRSNTPSSRSTRSLRAHCAMPPVVKTLFESLLTALDCTKRAPEANAANRQAREAQRPIMPKGPGSADPAHCAAAASSATITSPHGSWAGQDLRVSIPTPEQMRARPRNACGRPRSERKTSVYGQAERARSPPKTYRVLSRTEAGGPPRLAAGGDGTDMPPLPMPGCMPSPDSGVPGGTGSAPLPGNLPGGDNKGGGATAANGGRVLPPLPGKRTGSSPEASESVSMETPHDACVSAGAYSKSAYDQAFWSVAASHS